ncbi:hypothetical protein PV04_00341 [Phialophora macrospora]|uniref:Uncharacterized protein n=1 Tax=Phialophora macrospora TaxID=1851006 RepID=A0A0D2D3M6_9EURO|nr:hypothetical protein PV04_00341 [Phialophora macrospora]
MLDPLEENRLRSPLREDVRLALVNRIWGASSDRKLCAYIQYYEDQCRHADTAAERHSEVVDAIEMLKGNTETRESLRRKLSSVDNQGSPGEIQVQVEALLALVVRLWLMVNVGNVGPAWNPGQTQVHWTEGTIHTFINETFTPDHELDTQVKLEKIFNARNLQRISGIRVSWTDNIVDHLSMRDDDTRVLIFHHASFLHLHRDFNTGSPFTLEFLDETLRTLSLLLPPNDRKTIKWFKQKQRQFNLDLQAGRGTHLNATARQIENFKYWRDRLVILKQAFDESEPKTVSQWWNDDRKKVQWYTFWVAALVLALTIVFGLIQSISGIVQAWASVKALHADYPS